jgi:hypothetical protein
VTAGREEALRLEAYLDSTEVRGPRDGAHADALDPDLRRAIEALRAGLLRAHPSFRFVEELATRLAREADALLGVSPRATAQVVAFPAAAGGANAARVQRGTLVRGAISGVSIAGVAIVAWRIGRGSPASRRDAVARAFSVRGWTA